MEQCFITVIYYFYFVQKHRDAPKLTVFHLTRRGGGVDLDSIVAIWCCLVFQNINDYDYE